MVTPLRRPEMLEHVLFTEKVKNEDLENEEIYLFN